LAASHLVGLLWTSDQPVAKASAYTRQYNIETQRQNIHASSRIRTHDPGNEAVKTYALGHEATGTGLEKQEGISSKLKLDGNIHYKGHTEKQTSHPLNSKYTKSKKYSKALNVD
jgi:hypothetical protein